MYEFSLHHYWLEWRKGVSSAAVDDKSSFCIVTLHLLSHFEHKWAQTNATTFRCCHLLMNLDGCKVQWVINDKSPFSALSRRILCQLGDMLLSLRQFFHSCLAKHLLPLKLWSYLNFGTYKDLNDDSINQENFGTSINLTLYMNILY